MKQKTVFLCSDCGYESPKWYGKCPSCGAWNTMSEFKPAAPSAARGTTSFVRGASRPTLLGDIETGDEARFLSGIGELDRVLGGGAVHGSFVLVGGEPGIGKSTLLLQMCQEMCRNARVLYVSGEESLRQIKLRAARLHISSPELYILSETDMDQIINETELMAPDILIVDSIQTVYKRDLTAAPGGTTQIKECAMSLMQYAKNKNVTIFIVGHVNKEGTLAGPKILEHMVDCVLYFEGESAGPFRCLRAAKNRFGSTNEIGVFEMSEHGLVEVANPSAAMLAGHPQGASGNCIACVMEGSRPLLAEVQALAAKTQFGVPRRTAAGVDYNRMVLLLAILEKRCGLFLSSSDVYVNVVGGMRLDEPAVDLPMLLAIASSFRDKPLPEGVMSFGEVGLTGELRAGETVRGGFPCAVIADLSSLRVRAETPELYADELRTGQKANITLAAADRMYAARVASLAPVAVQAVSLAGDSGSVTVETMLDLEGDMTGLRPGSSATVKIFTDHRKKAVVVPYEAVCQRGEQEYVFTIENGRAVQNPVATGYLLERVIEVRSGLEGGETVILSPSDELENGAKLEVQP